MTPAFIRLRRKVEIMRLDFKATNNPKYHDCNEMLALIDIIEREMKNEKPS
jgi:hypothetical protein